MELADVMVRLESVVHTVDKAAVPVDETEKAAVSVAGAEQAVLSVDEVKAALLASSQVESFVAALRAELIVWLRQQPTAFPEAAIAETSGCSLGVAGRETERARTLQDAAAVAAGLRAGVITTGHVDALTRAVRGMNNDARARLLADDEGLAAVAAAGSVRSFVEHVRRRRRALETDGDAEDRLDRQRRAARVSSWTDDDGMWNLKGTFDPALGKDLARRLAAATKAKLGGELPVTAPSDQIERAQHLEALALADLILGTAPASTAGSGAPLVVVDATQPDGAGGPTIDWGLPVELPKSVLLDLFGFDNPASSSGGPDGSGGVSQVMPGQHEWNPDVVVVRNGIVLYAPGTLDLGRSTRLASTAQRRALRGLYSTCAVPGCAVHYDRCKLHHIVWWRNGGRTDLINLLPVCQHHHTMIHNNNWIITLGPNRQLTIRLPDGQILSTGPPTRSAA